MLHFPFQLLNSFIRYMKSNLIIMLILFLPLVILATNQGYLNNIPITFQLQGSTNYVPSTGGIAIPGYTIRIGFDRYQWLGTHTFIKGSCSWA